MRTATRQNPTVNTTHIQSVAFKSVTRASRRRCRAKAPSSAVAAKASTARAVASRHAGTSRISKGVPDAFGPAATAARSGIPVSAKRTTPSIASWAFLAAGPTVWSRGT